MILHSLYMLYDRLKDDAAPTTSHGTVTAYRKLVSRLS